MSTILPQKEKLKKKVFFASTWEEMQKVSWPEKKDLFFSTKSVIFATLLSGMVIYAVDLSIRGVLGGVASLFHWVFG